MNKIKRIIQTFSIYFILILISFVFLYPIFYMISYSFMGESDLVNPLVKWIPRNPTIGNYLEAIKVLDYSKSLWVSFLTSLLPSALQVITASVVGYGFSRFKFYGKNFLFALMLLSFIVPPQVTMIPQFLMYRNLGLLGTIYSYIIPAMFSQGIRNAIFILIFYQFFNMFPKSIEEAAKIDGARAGTIFFKIAVPSAFPAYLISFLFSIVWYWNETSLASLYLGNELKPLTLRLLGFADTFRRLYPFNPNSPTGKNLNEAIIMAGTLLTILPLILIYFIAQRWFVESIDRVGITGE